MIKEYAIDEPRQATTAASLKNGRATALLAVAFILLLAFLLLYLQGPSAAVGAEAPPSDFSSARAMEHLRVIAEKPRPVGSAHHAAARDYIFRKLSEAGGLEPQVQKTTVVSPQRGLLARAGTVENVVGRLRGTEGGQAVMLAAHYDSVPTSFGASDDGAGVAQMLETLRALKAGGALKRDVIFLFTDAEEVGLLGAQAFVAEHPWAKDVGVVLNFEARGNGGPVLMFETSGRNGRLVGEFAKAVPHPVTNSLLAEVYKLLPHDTDLSQFRAAGLPGLNFAYIDGLTHYHTRLDSIAQLDERSLQHQGASALALARHFGGLDLRDLAAGDSVFFDLFGRFLLRYPAAWVLPLTVLALLLLAAVVVYGFRRKGLRVSGMVWGFAGLLLNLVVVWLVLSLGWMAVLALRGGDSLVQQGITHGRGLFAIGFTLLAVGLSAVFFVLLRRRAGLPSLLAGALIWWALLTALTSLYLPGGSYLFVWPLLAGVVALYLMLAPKPGESGLVARFVCALPALLLLVPIIHLLFVALPLNMARIVSVFVVLLFWVLTPLFDLITAKRLLPPVATLAAGIAFVAAGAFASGPGDERPRVGNLFYAANADTGKALWGSAEFGHDAWTRQFFATDARVAPLPEFFPFSQREFLQASAPDAALPAPNVSLLGEERTADGGRTLRLRVSSPRQSPVVVVQAESGANISAATVGGKRVEQAQAGASNRWAVRYYNAGAEPLDITLELKSADPVKLSVTDQSYELPPQAGTAAGPRPGNVMPSPLPYSDATFVSKSFTF